VSDVVDRVLDAECARHHVRVTPLQHIAVSIVRERLLA
jgi:hypothetical protein